ncbi:MAG: hypothetical protein ACI9G1_002860 [Pirellulaceae bacterium]|jgi:hypothetical protein
MIRNRVFHQHADFIFLVIRKPDGWEPTQFDDVPPRGEVLSEDFVASHAEAHDDLQRCNQLALDLKLDKWAVIQAPSGGL